MELNKPKNFLRICATTPATDGRKINLEEKNAAVTILIEAVQPPAINDSGRKLPTYCRRRCDQGSFALWCLILLLNWPAGNI